MSSRPKSLTKSRSNLLSPKSKQFHSSNELVLNFRQYRENLTKKLNAIALMYSSNSPLKCLSHNSYISLYNKLIKKPICAVCYSQTKSDGKNELKHQDNISQTKTIRTISSTNNKKNSKNKTNQKSAVITIPIEQAVEYMEKDFISMKSQLQKQIQSLKKIQQTLYEGFDRQLRCFGQKIIQINKLESDLCKSISQHFEGCRILLDQTIKKQKHKHEDIIKQVTLLREIVKDYCRDSFPRQYDYENSKLYREVSPRVSTTKELVPYTQEHKNKINLLHLVDSPLHNKLYTEQKQYQQKIIQQARVINSRNILKAFAQSAGDRSPKRLNILQTTLLKHLIQSQIIQNLNFSNRKFSWEKMNHKNQIKQIGEAEIHKIQEIFDVIKRNKHKNQSYYRYDRPSCIFQSEKIYVYPSYHSQIQQEKVYSSSKKQTKTKSKDKESSKSLRKVWKV